MKILKKNILLLTILTLGILYFVLKDDFYGITNILLGSNIFYIVLIFVFLTIGDLAKSFSLWYIIKEHKKDYKLISAYLLVLKTNFFNGITPFALGGQPFQLYTLKNNDNIDYSEGVNVLFKDYYAYQFSFLLLSTLLIIINSVFHIVSMTPIMKKFVFIGYLIILGICLLLVYVAHKKNDSTKIVDSLITFLSKIKIIKNRDEFINKTHESIERIRKHVRNKNEGMMFKCYILNGIKFISLGFAAYFAFKAAYIANVPLLASIIIIMFVMIIASFIPIPGGSGGMEYGFITMFSGYVVGTKLNATMILWRFTGFHILVILGALVFILQERHRMSKELKNE